MIRQGPFRRRSGWLLTCLALGVCQACARPDAFRRGESGATQKLPFHASADHAADDPARPAIPIDHRTSDSAPFRANAHPTVPAGTLITVRLENSIAHVRAGKIFAASLAGPVTVGGATLIARGVPVSCQIEATQPPMKQAGLKPEPALVRVTLSAIAVDGRSVAVQTASLFAKGSVYPTPTRTFAGGMTPGDYRLPKGRELTFRLISPLTLSDANSLADRQYPDSSR